MILYEYDMNMNLISTIFGHGQPLWVACAAVLLLGLSLLDDLRFLTPASIFGLTCSLGFAVLVVVEASSQLMPTRRQQEPAP